MLFGFYFRVQIPLTPPEMQVLKRFRVPAFFYHLPGDLKPSNVTARWTAKLTGPKPIITIDAIITLP